MFKRVKYLWIFFVLLFFLFSFSIYSYDLDHVINQPSRDDEDVVEWDYYNDLRPNFRILWEGNFTNMSIDGLYYENDSIDKGLLDFNKSHFESDTEQIFTETEINFTENLKAGRHNLRILSDRESIDGDGNTFLEKVLLNYSFIVSVDDLNVTLKTPEPVVSDNIGHIDREMFELEIETNIKSNCKYSAQQNDYDEIRSVLEFDTDDGIIHTIDFENHYGGDNKYLFYIVCMDEFDRQSDHFLHTIYYNADPPNFIDFDFFPRVITNENDPFQVTITTNEESFCKLDFETDEFSEMEYNISSEYEEEHQNDFTLPSYSDDSYDFNVVCKNPAGLKTKKTSSVNVDTSVGYEITYFETNPPRSNKILDDIRPDILIETSGSADCGYIFDNDDVRSIDGSRDNHRHRTEIHTDLNEGRYNITAECYIHDLGDYVTDSIELIIDSSPPTINSIDVTPDDCERKIDVDIDSDDYIGVNEVEYYIGSSPYDDEGYDKYEFSTASSDSFTYEGHAFIIDEELDETFYINLRVSDGYNGWSDYHSQSFSIDFDEEECAEYIDLPEIYKNYTLIDDEIYLELNCTAGDVGCDLNSFEYGLSNQEADCNTNISYINPFLINESGWGCYRVESNEGIPRSSTFEIDYDEIKSDIDDVDDDKEDLVTRDELKIIIEEVKDDFFSIENLSNNYTNDSWNDLYDSFQLANETYHNNDSTSDEIDNSYNELKDAIDNLDKIIYYNIQIYIYEEVDTEIYDEKEFPISYVEIMLNGDFIGETDFDGFFNYSFKSSESEEINKNLETSHSDFDPYSIEISLDENQKNFTENIFLSEKEVDETPPDHTDEDFNILVLILRILSFLFFISSLVLFFLNHKDFFDNSLSSNSKNSKSIEKNKKSSIFNKNNSDKNNSDSSLFNSNNKNIQESKSENSNKDQLMQAMMLKHLKKSKNKILGNKKDKILDSFETGKEINKNNELDKSEIQKLKKKGEGNEDLSIDEFREKYNIERSEDRPQKIFFNKNKEESNKKEKEEDSKENEKEYDFSRDLESKKNTSNLFKELDELKREHSNKEIDSENDDSDIKTDDIDSIIKELGGDDTDNLNFLLNEINSIDDINNINDDLGNNNGRKGDIENHIEDDNEIKNNIINDDNTSNLELQLPPEISQITNDIDEKLNEGNDDEEDSNSEEKEDNEKEDDSLDSLVNSVINMKKSKTKGGDNVFKTVLSTLLSTNKINKNDVHQILLKLNEKGILNKKEVSDMFFDLTK